MTKSLSFQIKPIRNEGSRVAFFAKDIDHIPYNKHPGEVAQCVAELLVEDQPRVGPNERSREVRGDWISIRLTEITTVSRDPDARTQSRTISFTLDAPARKALRDYLNEMGEQDWINPKPEERDR